VSRGTASDWGLPPLAKPSPKELSKRRTHTHSPEFKARVAMEAISGRKTLHAIAADYAVLPV